MSKELVSRLDKVLNKLSHYDQGVVTSEKRIEQEVTSMGIDKKDKILEAVSKLGEVLTESLASEEKPKETEITNEKVASYVKTIDEMKGVHKALDKVFGKRKVEDDE